MEGDSGGVRRRMGKRDSSTRQGFRDLFGWQKAVKLTVARYAATKTWPRDERFALTSQPRWAAVAVPSNIAEGHGRSGPHRFLHRLAMAFGSLCDVETRLVLAQQLGYLTADRTQDLSDRLAAVRRCGQEPIRGRRLSSGERHHLAPSPWASL